MAHNADAHIAFLKARNVWKQFLTNLASSKHSQFKAYDNIDLYVVSFKSQRDLDQNFMNHAFMWDDTPEEHCYWESIHDALISHLENI